AAAMGPDGPEHVARRRLWRHCRAADGHLLAARRPMKLDPRGLEAPDPNDPNYKRKPGERKKTKDRAYHSEIARARIQAGLLIDLLQKNAKGQLFITVQGQKVKQELSLSRLRAIEILLKKVVPDLIQTDVNASITHRYVVEMPPPLSEREWLEKYGTKEVEEAPSLPLLEHKTRQ